MTFLRGFFLVSFLPFGIMILAGVWLFFRCNCKQEKWYYPLLFIISVLIAISLWRIPVVIDRRYAVPILVPGIVISTFVLILLPGILDKFKVSSAKAITRIVIVGLFIVCAAKAMRPQESKEYLHEIAEAIKQDCQKNNIKNNVVLLVCGNPGGYLEQNNNVAIINVKNKHFDDKFADVKYQFKLLQGTLDPEVLKIRYPHLYLLSVEHSITSFSNDWEKEYRENPKLIYEYIRPKAQTALRLYRIKSPHELDEIPLSECKLTNKDNLLRNGDLKKKYRISPEDNITKILHNRGISLFDNGEVYIPAGWAINPGDGWKTNCGPVSIKFAGNGTVGLNFQSKKMISIYSDDILDCNKTYLLEVHANSENRGCLRLAAYTYSENDKYIRTIILRDIELNINKNCYRVYFKLKDCNRIRLALIFSGNVTIYNINVLLQEYLKKTIAKG